MRAMRQPTRFTLEKATRLGQMMAQQEPRIAPSVAHAHEYTSYVEFIQAHRHRMEQDKAFAPWDTRLGALTESEGKMLGFVLSDRDEWDEFIASIATPIRCAFWYGWETARGVRALYDQHVQAAQARDSQIQIVQVRDAPDAPKVTRKPILDESDAFWDHIADSMLASLDHASPPAGHDPTHNTNR